MVEQRSHKARLPPFTRRIADALTLTLVTPFCHRPAEDTVEYGDEMQLSDGSRLEMERWERPHLFLDARGEPRDLYNGVSPKGGGTMANETGHCFTAVHGCKTDDGTLVN